MIQFFKTFSLWSMKEAQFSRGEHMETLEDLAILRIQQVMLLTGLSRTTIYEMRTKGTFPKQVQLGPRTIGWRMRDIRKWLKTRQTAA